MISYYGDPPEEAYLLPLAEGDWSEERGAWVFTLTEDNVRAFEAAELVIELPKDTPRAEIKSVIVIMALDAYQACGIELSAKELSEWILITDGKEDWEV